MQSETLRVIWIRAADYRKGRGGKPINAIVLHSTCGRKRGDIPTLTEAGGPVVSCHYYVTRQGEIYGFVREEDTAYHAGRVRNSEFGNASTIGIECEHFDPDEIRPRGEDWPYSQVQAVAKLVAYLRKKYKATYGHLEVTSHEAIAAPPGRKIDPHDFPWTLLSIMTRTEMHKAWKREYVSNSKK